MRGTRNPSVKATKTRAARVKRAKPTQAQAPAVPVQVPVAAQEQPEGHVRGDRGKPQEWRVVGSDKHGQVLVEVPSWHGLHTPRGVDGPHNYMDWQSRQCPASYLVDPKTHPD